MRVHHAQCSCGQLSLNAEGEPDAVVVCHCLACQRRSGSPFGTGAYYDKARVDISGRAKTFTRVADSGGRFTHYFCPECGTVLYWLLALKPDQIGVALGAFGDPTMMAPARSVWEDSKHPWVAFAHELAHFPRSRSGAALK